MALEQAGTITMAEMMKEIENLKTKNQALEEAKLKALQEAKLNRAEEDERLTQALMKMNRYMKEVEEIPRRMEKLHERIRALVQDCRKIKMDLENVSKDMKETIGNKALCQSISSVVGIIGGAVVLTAGTGGVGLVFSIVGFAASTFGSGTRTWYDNQAKEQTRRAEKSQMETEYKEGEFVEDYKILADIRDRFMKSELFSCVELKYFKSHAVEINDVLNEIVEILRTLDKNNHEFVEKFDNMKNNYLLGVIAKRQKGVEEEHLCKEILNTIRDHVADHMPDEVGKSFVRGSDTVLEIISNKQKYVDPTLIALKAGGAAAAAANFVASQSKILSVSNITTDVATGVEQAGELVAGWGSTLTMAAKGIAVVTIIIDIAKLVSTYYTYKSEKAESEKLVEQAELLKKKIEKLEEVNKSIDSFRINFNKVLDGWHKE